MLLAIQFRKDARNILDDPEQCVWITRVVSDRPYQYDEGMASRLTSPVLPPSAGTTSRSADDRTEEQVRAAKDYAFNGISFSTSVNDLKKLYPKLTAIKDGTEAGLKLETYVINEAEGAKPADALCLYFCDGALYKMKLLYTDDMVKGMGGLGVLVGRVANKFGKPDEDSLGIISEDPPKLDTHWGIKDAGRRIEMWNSSEERIGIVISDLPIVAKLQAAKEKAAKTGFE